jgi:aspartate carbamoyltransferase catalytic subunit
MNTVTQNLSTKHLLGIKDLTSEDIRLIFQTAVSFKDVLNRPIKKVPSLRDLTIANLFFENSTRTRISFELAEKRLSADVVNFSASSSSLKKGETLLDTVNNILSMKVDMVVMRHPAPGACQFLSHHIDANIINAGDGTHEHPTQALLDAFSIQAGSSEQYILFAKIGCKSPRLRAAYVNPQTHPKTGCGSGL